MAGHGGRRCANPVGCPEFDARLEAFSQRVIDAIRTVDRTTAVFYEPNVIFNNGAQTTSVRQGDNLGFSFHDYCLTAEASAEGGLDEAVRHLRRPRLDQHCRSRAGRTGHPPLLTEFGATDRRARRSPAWSTGRPGPDRLAVLGLLRLRRPDHDRAGRRAGTGARPGRSRRPGPNIDQAKLRALVVPHPLAVSGTPLRYRFDRATAASPPAGRSGAPTGRAPSARAR